LFVNLSWFSSHSDVPGCVYGPCFIGAWQACKQWGCILKFIILWARLNNVFRLSALLAKQLSNIDYEVVVSMDGGGAGGAVLTV
jgi:hypothetical protein